LALIPVGTLRPAIRFITYASSLTLLALLPGKGRLHPAAKVAMVILAILVLSMLHPATNSLLAGAAQVTMYVAILAPLFWVARLPVDVVQLQRVMPILWAFHTASSPWQKSSRIGNAGETAYATIANQQFAAQVGQAFSLPGLLRAASCVAAIIQVSYPGLLPQNLSSMTVEYGSGFVESMQFRNASGAAVFRPMGLSDVPGVAAASGFYAVLIGLGVLVRGRACWLRLAALFAIGVGFTSVYLSQVRSTLVMVAVCVIALQE
jgi:hypothetical protein